MALSQGQTQFPYSCSDQSALFMAWEHNRIKKNGIQKCGYLGLKNLWSIWISMKTIKLFVLCQL